MKNVGRRTEILSKRKFLLSLDCICLYLGVWKQPKQVVQSTELTWKLSTTKKYLKQRRSVFLFILLIILNKKMLTKKRDKIANYLTTLVAWEMAPLLQNLPLLQPRWEFWELYLRARVLHVSIKRHDQLAPVSVGKAETPDNYLSWLGFDCVYVRFSWQLFSILAFCGSGNKEIIIFSCGYGKYKINIKCQSWLIV